MKLLPVMACAFLVWAQSVYAATVVVVRPSSPSAEVTEMLTLLHGELSSMALDDTTIDRPAPNGSAVVDFRTWLEQLATQRSAFAVIDIVGDDAVAGVDVWVRKSPGRFEVTRVSVDPGMANAAARLAIRAIEALRASVLEGEFAARYLNVERAKKTAVTPARVLPKPSTPPRAQEHIGLELGASLLMSPGGVGPAVLPLMRLDWAIRPSLLAQATLAGFGSKPAVTAAAGAASVAREYAVLGAGYRMRAERPWWPLFSIAAGVLHTSVEGQPSLNMNARAVHQWSLLADAGLGAALRLYGSCQLALSGHAQLMHPYLAIHFGDPVIATAGRPNLLLSLAAGGWL